LIDVCYSGIIILPPPQSLKEVLAMATVIDVAKYVIHKREATMRMELGKLCYYAQAWTLAWLEEPLFDEDFQAWDVGAVCMELYEALTNRAILRDGMLGKYVPNALDESQKKCIDIVLEDYADLDPEEFRKIAGKALVQSKKKFC
jgi:uncharacterized phage-associated protein